MYVLRQKGRERRKYILCTFGFARISQKLGEEGAKAPRPTTHLWLTPWINNHNRISNKCYLCLAAESWYIYKNKYIGCIRYLDCSCFCMH